MNKKSMILTGFEPFGNYGVNSSWEAIRGLAGRRVGGLKLRPLLLPVEYRRGPEILLAEIGRIRPAAVVAFGVAPGPAVRPERTARNRSGGKPDSAGETGDGPVVAGAPATIPGRLPCEGIASALAAAGFASEISDDAGGYVCNALFYRLLHYVPATVPAGFVHLPPVGLPYDRDELQRAVLVTAAEVARLLPPGNG